MLNSGIQGTKKKGWPRTFSVWAASALLTGVAGTACTPTWAATATAAGDGTVRIGAQPMKLPDAPDAWALRQTQPTQNGQTPASQSQAAPADGKAVPPAKAPQPGDSNYSLQGAEHQRILGIIPEFQAVNRTGEYKPLTPKQ